MNSQDIFTELANRGINTELAYTDQTGGGTATMVVGPFRDCFAPMWREHDTWGAVQIGPGTFNWGNPFDSEFSFDELFVGLHRDGERDLGGGATNYDELATLVLKGIAIEALATFAEAMMDSDDDQPDSETLTRLVDAVTEATGVDMDRFDLARFAADLTNPHSELDAAVRALDWAAGTFEAIVHAQGAVLADEGLEGWEWTAEWVQSVADTPADYAPMLGGELEDVVAAIGATFTGERRTELIGWVRERSAQ